MIHEVYLKALTFFSSHEFSNEFLKSRIYFFQNSDVLDEAHPNYFQRNHQFLDWYFFSRPLDSFRLPPSHCVFMLPNLTWNSLEEPIVSQLKNVKHSLFLIDKVKENLILVTDLFENKTLEIPIKEQASFYIKGQVFDGRYLLYNRSIYLFDGKCFHPQEASKLLIKFIKEFKNDFDFDREKFLLLTLKMRYLYDRHPNARLEQVYSFQNRWFKYEEASKG